MRAFLSHSSKDKGFVEGVAEGLGTANVELDSLTFDRGLLTVSAIQQALTGSLVFVLFLSNDSLSSSIVQFESSTAQELQARGIIDRILVVCLDDGSFKIMDEKWKVYNFVRKATSIQSVTRLIQNALIIARSRGRSDAQPFVGRSSELHRAKEKLIDPLAHSIVGIYVSGNAGIGRRTFVRKLYRDVFPSVNSVFPEIQIDPLDGYEELYRKISELVAPTAPLSAWRARVAAFALEKPEGRSTLIAQVLSNLLIARESIVFRDQGGLLDDSGSIQVAIRKVVDQISDISHPPIIFVAERMVPQSKRSDTDRIVYCSLPSLAREESRQLIALLLKRHNISYSRDQLEELVDLCDGHPFNASFVAEAARQYTLPIFLADTSTLVDWKRRRAAEFLQKIHLSEDEARILAGLRNFRSLDFDTIVSICDKKADTVASALTRLIDFHIVEPSVDTFQVSPPLKAAVERDARMTLSPTDRKRMLKTVAGSLTARGENDAISVSLVDAAILAQLQDDGEVPEFFAAFVLPSHLVWVARRYYDQKRFPDCIRLAAAALEGKNRLSPAGVIEACRFLCLAAARVNDNKHFQIGITILKQGQSDPWARSNVNFLLGFEARLQGNLPEAEAYMREAYDLSPGNFQAARELAFICMVLGDLPTAEEFARKAYSTAPDNPYVLDILLSILIKKPPQARANIQAEIDYLFESLKQVGDDEGQSFYVTRRAEYELKGGHIGEACRLIDEAIRKTPGIVRAHILRAEIYLERGNNLVAHEEIQSMHRLLGREQTGERHTYLRPLLEVESDYYVQIGNYQAAKDIYRRTSVFTPEEAKAAIKRIELDQAYKKHK